MNIRKLLCSLFVVSSLSLHGYARQAENNPEMEARIDSIFHFITDKDPGVAIAITKEGDIAFAKAYGMANLEHQIPATTDSRFHLISASKQFTSYGLMILEEQGLLSIDDEVRYHYPAFPDFGYGITIRQLLTHTSGLRQSTHLEDVVGRRISGLVMNHERSLELLLDQNELNFEPGSQYGYSNGNYVILAALIAEITGQPFHKWMQTHVFEPLEMHDTFIHTDYRDLIPNRAEPYHPSGNHWISGWDRLWAMQGGTGIYSTVLDLTKWINFMLNPPKEAKTRVTRMAERGTLNSGEKIHMANGIIHGEMPAGFKNLYHGGDGWGYEAHIKLYPEQKLGVAFLTNTGRLPTGYADKVVQLFLPTRDEAEVTATEKEHFIDPEILDTYTGTYVYKSIFNNNEEMKMVIRRNENKLLLFPQSRGSGVPIVSISDTTFELAGGRAIVTFHRESNGEVNSYTITDNLGERPETGYRTEVTEIIPDYDSPAEFIGTYYSPELKVTYEIIMDGEALILKHLSTNNLRRWEDMPLDFIETDTFESSRAYSPRVFFERNSTNGIKGMRLTNGTRAQNIWFVRKSDE